MNLPIFKQKIMTGIDIQPEAIQLVQLSRHKQGYSLQKIAALPLETPIFTESKITGWDKLTSLLFEWLRELDLVGAVTAAALPCHAVKLLPIAAIAAERQVKIQVDQILPGLYQDLAVDYCHLSGPAGTLIAAAKRDYLDRYADCLGEAGLDVKIMDVDIFALQRAVGVNALLWQRRQQFQLIWQDEAVPQQTQWPAVYGEQAVFELSSRLSQHNIPQVKFCGSSYYCDLFKKAPGLHDTLSYFSPPYIKSGVNMPDYLLAIGLAMREMPSW